VTSQWLDLSHVVKKVDTYNELFERMRKERSAKLLNLQNSDPALKARLARVTSKVGGVLSF
jgi:hypothetical protein